ncbi:MAG: ion transporter [Polyangiaceae bacterium]|nr:ion transporter [Polyangiaceae bacterium]
MMTTILRKIAESTLFQVSITLVILFAGFLVGVETYPALAQRHASLLHMLDRLVLAIFTLEVVIKMGAEGRRPLNYFKDGWNTFDFIIVAACFLPFSGQAITVLRLLRLLRVLKLVRALPKLQILVSALLKSIPSMGYVTLLLVMLFYVYAVAAVFLFGTNDPLHFSNLENAMLSLFRVVTLEDWTDIMYINMYGCDQYGYGAESLAACVAPSAAPLLSPFFFVSFVLIGTMVIMNLFVGVIMSGMDEAQAEAAREREEELRRKGELPSVGDEFIELEKQLEELQAAVQNVHRRITDQRASLVSIPPRAS